MQAFEDIEPVPFGSYLLLERLAMGGMAEVFLARPTTGSDIFVALKRILPSVAADDEFVAMFIDEAKIAGQLHHAGIAQILDIGKIDGAYFIAMEYVSGHDLRSLWDHTRDQGPGGKTALPIPIACHIVRRLCEGLDYAHRKKDAKGRPLGIIHRDVSPQNILISYDGDLKIIDFGIAKAANRIVRTQTGILKGKFAYMSPEQARGEPIDHRSDVFAIGTVLYELLTGERAFRGETDFALLEKVRRVDVIPPRKLRGDVPRELERIVFKALAADASDRYSWASALGNDLDRFMSDQGMTTAREELGAWVRRTFREAHAEEQRRLQTYRKRAGAAAGDANGATVVRAQPSARNTPSAGDRGAAYDDAHDLADDATVERSVIAASSADADETLPPAVQPAIQPAVSSASARARASSPMALPTSNPELQRLHERARAVARGDAIDDDDVASRLERGSPRAAGVSSRNVDAPGAASLPSSLSLSTAGAIPGSASRRRRRPPSGAIVPPSMPDDGSGAVLASSPLRASPTSMPRSRASGRELVPPPLPETLTPTYAPDALEQTDASPAPPQHVDDNARQDDAMRDDGGRMSQHASLSTPPPPRSVGTGVLLAATLVGALLGAAIAAGIAMAMRPTPPDALLVSMPRQAEVRLGTRVLCAQTPCAVHLGPGRHALAFQAPGAVSVTREVDVGEAGSVVVDVLLERASDAVRVETEPAGASVMLDDAMLPGTTPLTLPAMRVGRSVRLRIMRDGYDPLDVQRVIDGNETWSYALPTTSTTWTVIASPPDAHVFAGRLYGVGSLTVPVGRRPVVVKALRAGCKPQQATLSLTGRANADQPLQLDCGPLDGAIEIRSQRRPTSVKIDGIDLPRAADLTKWPMSAGTWNVLIRGSRGRPEAWTIEVRAGETTTIQSKVR